MNKWSILVAVCVILGGSAFALVALLRPSPTKPVERTAPMNISAVPAQPVSNTLPAHPSPQAGTTAKAATTPLVKPASVQPDAHSTPNVAHPQNPSTMAPTAASPPNSAPFAKRTPGAQASGSAGERRGRGQRPASFALLRLFRGVGRLEEEGGKTPLTQAQAQAILAIMTPLRTKPTLKPEEAVKTQKQLEAQLTASQRDTIAQSAPQRGGWGGRPQGGADAGRQARPDGAGGPPPGMAPGGGREGSAPGMAPDNNQGGPRGRGFGMMPPGGEGQQGQRSQGRPGGGMPFGGMPAMDPNMNPFYTSGDNPMAARMAERNDAVFTALKAKANQK